MTMEGPFGNARGQNQQGEDLAQLLLGDTYSYRNRRSVSKTDATGVGQAKFDDFDTNHDGGLTKDELTQSAQALSARGDKSGAKVAQTMLNHFKGLSEDDNQITIKDLAGYRYRHDELKKEQGILQDVQRGGADPSFKKITGDKDATVQYSQIENALMNDKLSAKDRDMLGYILLNYNRIEEQAKRMHPDQQGITLADVKMSSTQRLTEMPDVNQIDKEMTTVKSWRVKVPMKSSHEIPPRFRGGEIPNPRAN